MKNTYIQDYSACSPKWIDPRHYAATLKAEPNVVFLYSGMSPGRYSIIAWELVEKIDSLNILEQKLKYNSGKFEEAWFGFLGYGLRVEFEKLQKQNPSSITLPDLLMMKFKHIAIFDHFDKTVKSNMELPLAVAATSAAPAAGAVLKSNMSDVEYLDNVSAILAKIRDGELYQANLTRKFFGEFKNPVNGLEIFNRLSVISPAPYSSYIKFDGIEIISASPEKFLTVENGIATTTPIKGTISSKLPAGMLADSEKDKSENLMIVDLMRNDLSRACNNVKVEKLFEVTSYAKYHHMSSTISGSLKTNALDVVKACFPPGSMTGAPKIQAMKLCAELETVERGVYSGAIGYFGGDGSCDLSVVIRTIIISGNKFEFQVGGGIVADSTPEKELEEIYVKASAIMEVLGFKQPPELL